jgi:anti-sigma regulatory factor (Ser/Thr protein kinase)
MKRKQYQENKQLKIDFEDSFLLEKIKLNPDISEVRAVIGNLIDNSAEAIGYKDGNIKLHVKITSRNIEIHITDNGKGIPSDILPQLMIDGRSYEKPNGTGIGLVHAKETLEKLGGEVKITSQVGQGTTVSLIIPRFEEDYKFVKKLVIAEGSTIVIVDDDQLIHEAWKIKLMRKNIPSHEAHFFLTPEDFNSWIEKNGYGKLGFRHYFFDYDLENENFNGIDLIERHDISLESVLISGMAGESEVQQRTKRLGISCLRKDFLADISIEGISQV